MQGISKSPPNGILFQVNRATNCTMMVVAFSLLLAACGEAPKTRAAQRQPSVVATSTTSSVPLPQSNTIDEEKSESADKSNQAKPKKEDDETRYAVLDDSADFSASDTIKHEIQAGRSRIDLRVLRCYEKPITAADMKPFESQQAIRRIEELDISRLGLTDAAIEPIRGLHLKQLGIDANKCSELRVIENMRSLESLDVGKLPLTHSAYRRISKLTNLKRLGMRESSLKDEDLPALYGLSKLEYLDVANCAITYHGLQTLLAHLPPSLVYSCGENRHDDANNLGKYFLEYVNKHYKETEQALKERIPYWEHLNPPDTKSIEQGYGLLGSCLHAQAKNTEAEQVFSKGSAMELSDKNEDWLTANGSCWQYAYFLQDLKEYKKAIKLRKQCEARFAAHENSVDGLDIGFRARRAENLSQLGYALEKNGDLLEAAKYREAAAKESALYRRYDMAFANYVEEAKCYSKAGDRKAASAASRRAEDLCRFAQKNMTERERKLLGKGVPNIK